MQISAVAACTLIILACTAPAEQSSPVDSMPSSVYDALSSEKEGNDQEHNCHPRHYFTCKDARSPHVPRSDVELIDTLVPHHEMAIEMADMELAHGENPEVRAMAENMKADQMSEIAELLQIREELTGCTNVRPFRDPHMEQDMEEMADYRGLQMDVAFLAHMIPHHAGAVQFTHNALWHVSHPELEDLARGVIDAQSREIGEMHEKKQELCMDASVECIW
jgi:uncharacterized protein (DUF305 family)